MAAPGTGSCWPSTSWLLIVIGVQTIRRVSDADDFAVAGNRIIWPVFFGSLAASFLGGGASLGNAGATFPQRLRLHVRVLRVRHPDAAGRCLRRTAAEAVHRRAHRRRRDGRALRQDRARWLTGVLSLALCAGILGAQALAIGTVVNATIDLPTIPRSSLGMGVVIPLLDVRRRLGGDPDRHAAVRLPRGVPAAHADHRRVQGRWLRPSCLNSVPDLHTSFLGDWQATAFISLFLAFLLGETLVPPYTQRTFSTPDSRARAARIHADRRSSRSRSSSSPPASGWSRWPCSPTSRRTRHCPRW